jgi:hypothetical protein
VGCRSSLAAEKIFARKDSEKFREFHNWGSREVTTEVSRDDRGDVEVYRKVYKGKIEVGP